jgi:hypothetical protein
MNMRHLTRQSKTGIPAKLVLGTTLVALLVLLFPPRAAAVECVGDRTYETAVADGCTSITGSLNIVYPSRTNIDGLAGLTSVGSLGIESVLLENVDGLADLVSIQDSFYIGYNDALANLDGLAALESIGGFMIIWWNAALIDLDGLSALTSVGTFVIISDNDVLCPPSIDYLLSRITVGDYTQIYNDFGAGWRACGVTDLVASTLPASRSVRVGGTASAFATMINAGRSAAYECTLSLGSDIPATLTSWPTDPTTNTVVGEANASVGIPAGGFATWAFRIVPTGAIAPTEVELVYECLNADPAIKLPGISTLLLSASEEPIPDIIAVALTPTGDGILAIDGAAGAGAFATATTNVGTAGTLTVEPRLSADDTPLDLAICETDPAAGTCTSAIGPSVTTTIEADATPTFAVFATATGSIPLDPANYRIYIEFTDDQGEVRGSSSVAVTTE